MAHKRPKKVQSDVEVAARGLERLAEHLLADADNLVLDLGAWCPNIDATKFQF